MTLRSPRLAVPAAALLLGAACGRAPVEPPPETPALSAPEPSAALITSPLDSAATGFTNEMQAANLTKETGELGIQGFGKEIPDEAPQEPEEAPPPQTEEQKKEDFERHKRLRLEFARMRRSMESAMDKSVALEGTTAAIIGGRTSGGVIGAAEDSRGVWSGAYGGAVEAGERVVSDPARWAELWGLLSREAPPEVDFARTRIAATFVGTRPTAGYRARLVGIEVEPTRYVVRWLEEGPGPREDFAEGATAPYLLVSVPNDERAIRWEKIRRIPGQAERPKRR